MIDNTVNNHDDSDNDHTENSDDTTPILHHRPKQEECNKAING